MNTQPTEQDWLRAWEFAWAAPPEKHSVRLIIEGIKNPRRDVAITLRHAGYVVLQTWWMSWYPNKVPYMSPVFDVGHVLRKVNHAEYVKGFALELLVNNEVGNPAKYDSAKLELVTLPEAA